MNFAAKLLLVTLFGFTSVNQAFAQKPKYDSYELSVANPSYFRMYVCDFFLDDRVVTVMLDDQSVLSGKVGRIGSEEFSLESESGPVAVRLDRVRRLSTLAQHPSPASQARRQAIYFHTNKPKYIVRVKLRQNDRGGSSSRSVQGSADSQAPKDPNASAASQASEDPHAFVELTGRVIKADELSFVLKEKDSGVERELDYRDVQRISPTWEESVLDGFNTALLVLGLILLWPLAMLTGMDC